MTDQVLGGPLATQGWLAYPATNRVVFFDGRYLHGEHETKPSTLLNRLCGGSRAFVRVRVRLMTWSGLIT